MAETVSNPIRIPVTPENKSHFILLQNGLRHQLPDLLAEFNLDQQCVLLVPQQVSSLYQSVISSFQQAGFKLTVILIPDDESAKDIRQAELIWAQMVEAGCDRSSVLFALGGGVTGDLGGFVASTYMRGIRYVQIPTTLLAMVDSSIGGKTAVNLSAGKNLVGAIHQPAGIYIDPEFLATLPTRNVVSSLAEVVKYGLIRDPSIFDVFENDFDALIGLDDADLVQQVITASCQIKADIISRDPFEQGERKLLNFGHTIGHALETLGQYRGLYHGEAVLYGMQCAVCISHRKGLISDAVSQRIQTLLSRFSLPELPELSQVEIDQILAAVSHDKKRIGRRLQFILLEDIGQAVIREDVDESDLLFSLEFLKKTHASSV